MSDKFTVKKFMSRNPGLVKVSDEEFARVLNLWDKNFGADRAISGYEDRLLWHSFTYDVRPAVENEEAEASYRRLGTDQAFYILFSYFKKGTCYKSKGPLPTLELLQELNSGARPDVYLLGGDVEWALIFTHEEGLGPFFSDLELVRKPKKAV